MKLRHRRRLRALGLRALRLIRRHYVSMISAVVLSVAGGVALTSASFELPDTTPEAGAGAAPAAILADAAVRASPAPLVRPARQRRQAIIYLVMDETQGDHLVETHSNLIWDNHMTEDYQSLAVDYLVANSPETESDAIRELNYYIEMAAMRHVDLRVIDLRPGRGLAANSGAP